MSLSLCARMSATGIDMLAVHMGIAPLHHTPGRFLCQVLPFGYDTSWIQRENGTLCARELFGQSISEIMSCLTGACRLARRLRLLS